MRKTQKLLAVILVLVMVLCLNPLVSAADEAAVTVLYTNDIHTYIDGDLTYSKLAAYKQSYEDVILVDAGDHIQGTAYGSMDKGKTIIDLMNATGYDLATLGNHEFDYGMDGRIKVTDEWAQFPYVSCNFYNEKDGVAGDPVLDSYKVIEAGGLKIAFIGVTTPESFTKSTPAYFQDENGNYIYGIAGGEDGAALYAAVQKAIDAAAAEADIVIGLGHLGDDPASMPWTSEEVIANTTGLDAWIDGHSHSTVPMKAVADKDGNTVVLTQTGEYLGAIGKMSIAADGTITSELVAPETLADLTPDADVKAIEDAWIAEINEKLGAVIGSTEDVFTSYDALGNRLVRKQETNLGDFCADALYYLFDNMGLDVDVAIMNGGGIRLGLGGDVTGDISYQTCKTIHTFGNVACLQTITGQQLLDALEWGAKNVGSGENGGFLHVAGIKYTIDSSIPSTVQADDKGVWTGGPTGDYRVTDVQILQDGEYVALDLDAEYNLAGYNYTLRDLGDGFAMFDGAVNVLDYVMEDYMVLANYVQSFEGGVVTGYAEPQGRITIEDPSAVTILYTNDIHTYIDGDLTYSALAAYKDSLENVLLVDAGDHIQGTAYGSMDKGKTIIDLMNAAGYDLATLGNHEFDYGMDGRIKVTDEWAKFPYVSCNFYNEKDGVVGESVLDAYKVFEVNGKKIALIGITTPESFTKSTPAYFQDENGNYIYGIAGGEDGAALYAAVQKAIDAAAAEADYVIALAHLGDDKASQPWTSEEVIANTTGLDAFIDGHSHSTVPMKAVADKDGNTVVLTQTGEYLGAFGQMTIGFDGIRAELLTAEDIADVTPDADVKAIEDAWITEIDTKLGEVIGSTGTVTLNNYDADGNRLVRKYETNTGDFAADALYYLFDNMGLDVDVAIMNGGGIRNKAITGDISYKTCKDIHTFGNVACLQTITGQQLLDALEWGARQTPDVEVGGFLHVSGVKYTVDASVESTVQADDKGVWIGAPTGEYRVKNVQILQDGEYVDLDLEAKYNLAGYNYTLRDLGDGFAMFDGAVNVLDYVMEDYMVLANYVQSFEGGVLPETYAEPQGRITILDEGEEEETLGKVTIGGLTNDIWMTKYGNVYCDAKAELFAKEYTWGDIVTVKFLDQELQLPVIPTYAYVDSGTPAIIMGKTETGAPTGYISFAINMGNFADTYGIATKVTDEAGAWSWVAKDGVSFPIEITFEMAEAGGYMDQIMIRDLVRTNDRADYADLTDEEFANFRAIVEGKLYRSSSPINPELGRNTYADAAIEAAGVTVIMNLADSEEEAKAYEGFAETYYSEQNVIYLCLGVDFSEQSFKDGLAKGLKHFAANEGTYLIHCTEGKDRAGFVSALLESLIGMKYEDIIADYMVTYYNYYGVEEGTDKYTAIMNSNIVKSLQAAYGVEDLAKADLAAEAEEYLAEIGLTADEIAALKANLVGETVDNDVVVSSQTVMVNGEAVEVQAYNIDGHNYFKLRDVAAMLVGTADEFSITVDAAKRAVYVTLGAEYVPGGEELKLGADMSATCVESAWTLYVNGKAVAAEVYNIGCHNYFKLRDLGTAVDFGVHYDEATRCVQITAK